MIWTSCGVFLTLLVPSSSFLLSPPKAVAPVWYLSAVPAPAAESKTMNTPYSPSQLQEALDSLLEGSKDPDFDARHIYGYANADHTLSMLQTVTATRILDYQSWMSDASHPSEESLLEQAKLFAEQHGPILDLQKVIQSQSPSMALAAEFKRASPSKGDIAPHLKAGEQAQQYASAGANIVSVLTEEHWFKGSLADMTEARLETTGQSYPRPAILRKDFCVNEYMIAEAAAGGADTILLIVAVLPQHILKGLIDYSRALGMEPLVEVHADEELDVALEAGAKVLGVNNRNLHTFQMDLATTEHVATQLASRGLTYHHDNDNAEFTICALSGMSTALDVDRYRQSGIGMCLIGESLMRAADPAAAITSLCLHPNDFAQNNRAASGGAYTGGTQIVKVCGITNSEDALVACRAGANWIGVIFVPKSPRCVTPEQAREVVDAVRTFGERRERTSIPNATTGDNALSRLATSARALEEASRRPMVVGVFQNQSPEFVRTMVDECGLDLVQLHGQEGMAAANIEQCGVPAIRVVDIETDPETGKAAAGAIDALLQSLTTDPVAILLDTSIEGRNDGGGTGVTFDWSLAQRVQNAGLPVIIAGGLGPHNVQDAVSNIRPWGIDVSSGVEQAPGKKDTRKVQDFVTGARAAAIEANKGF